MSAGSAEAADGERMRTSAEAPDAAAQGPAPARVDVVLPCLNEAAALPWVLSRLPEGYRAIVVDNGSTDDSAAVARAAGALVVHESRRGFGAAAHAGLLAATAPIVAFCDADASMDPRELPRLVAALGESPDAGSANGSFEAPLQHIALPTRGGQGAGLVLGRRRPTERGAWPWHARFANLVLAGLIRGRAGIRVHDLGPMRVARREQLLALDLRDRRSGYPLEMLLRADEAGLRIRELDTAYSPRVGRSKVTGTIRGTITAITDMSRLLRDVKSDAPQAGTAEAPGYRLGRATAHASATNDL